MSRIYFHSPHGEAEVSGAERAHMAILIDPKHEALWQDDDRTFGQKLNEALARDDDAWRFVARIHGQCEIHAYVEGQDRAWLAGIIERGLASGLLRGIEMTGTREARSGWPAVIALLRERDDDPVVTSYSVCEGFPNLTIVREEGTWQPTIPSFDPEDEWYALPTEEQWATALAALRQRQAHGSRLRLWPEDWARWRAR